MKALIIILVIVGASFLALLVYGANRSESPKHSCEDFPTLGDPPDPDKLKDWCPPSFASKTEGLQAYFMKGLGIDPPAKLASSQFNAQFFVPRSKELARAAKIELVAGDWAILTGAGDERLCLCRPTTAMNDRLLGEECPAKWRQKRREIAASGRQLCGKEDARGILAFRKDPGVIAFVPGASAEVTIQ